jgi:L-alanine-DL-glutamate epimerase-like enolase superfamily enzyme
MQLTLTPVRWRLTSPFSIARETIDSVPALQIELVDCCGHRGRGEAVGIDYAGETPASMTGELEALRAWIESQESIDRVDLPARLPAGGARNALDAALWDLEAKHTGVSAWDRSAIGRPGRIATAFTIGLAPVAAVRSEARRRRHYPLLKLKVDATRHLELVDAVRAEAPGVALIVDANGSWTPALLDELAPRLAARGVALLEQPLAPDADDVLAGRRFALPLAADESFTDRRSVRRLADRYQYFNLKLDKTGGLTEALATAAAVEAHGGRLMVGNMCGSSLAMAPAVLLAPRCQYVDLDGPLLQVEDVACPLEYQDGWLAPPAPALWG